MSKSRSVRFDRSLTLVALLLTTAGCAHGNRVAPAPPMQRRAQAQPLTVRRPALYPETIEYDRARQRFLLGSFREGAVYEVDERGEVALRIEDARLCSVLGIAIDAARGRLWVVSGDLGASVRPSAAGPKQLAAVAVYDLASGRPIHYVDLAPLAPGPHLPNGIALDAAGNAYVSDSFAAAIYKVDAGGQASLLVRDDALAGPGIGLNGLVVHPDGYLLAVQKSQGALFKVPLADPTRFTRVLSDPALIGGDGVILVGPQALVVIANETPESASNAAVSLASDDGWQSATRGEVRPLGSVYPTTGVIREGTIYVVHSKLNELIRAPAEQKGALREQATITPLDDLTR